jgi:putative transposase
MNRHYSGGCAIRRPRAIDHFSVSETFPVASVAVKISGVRILFSCFVVSRGTREFCCKNHVDWVWALRPWRKIRLEVVKRLEGLKGFHVLPKRWIVERTFAWLNRYRRLSKDYEYLPQTSETMIRVAMIHLMIRRLARTIPF